MIPDLPPSVSDRDTMEFYNTLWANLSDQSSVHVNWHTHRQNPSTCWICDLYALTAKVMHITDKYLSKSSLDIGTELSSEDDSDSEIENESFDSDGIPNNEPEYELEDD